MQQAQFNKQDMAALGALAQEASTAGVDYYRELHQDALDNPLKYSLEQVMHAHVAKFLTKGWTVTPSHMEAGKGDSSEVTAYKLANNNALHMYTFMPNTIEAPENASETYEADSLNRLSNFVRSMAQNEGTYRVLFASMNSSLVLRAKAMYGELSFQNTIKQALKQLVWEARAAEIGVKV